MDECVEILENSPDALPSDKLLVQCIKLCHLMEDVGVEFLTDYPCSVASLSEPRVQNTLKLFEKRLEQWKQEIPRDLYSRKYGMAYSSMQDMETCYILQEY